MLQVSDPAVDELVVIRRRGIGKVALVNHSHRVTSQRGTPRNAGTKHPGSNDQNIELSIREFVASVLHRLSINFVLSGQACAASSIALMCLVL